MLKHKFLWFALVLGLVFGGCTSSDDDTIVNPPEKNTSVVEPADNTTNPPEDNGSVESGKNDGTVITEPVVTDPDIIPDEDNKSVVEPDEDNKSEESVKVINFLRISGIAIDGYIHGGTVKLAEKEANSSKTGNWHFELDGNDSSSLSNQIVTVSGGTDVSTGNPFEGILSNVVEDSNFEQLSYKEGEEKSKSKSTIDSIVLTPLTSLVVGMMKYDENLSKDEAFNLVAQSLEIKVETLKSDIVANLESEDEAKRLESAEAIKTALMIQKIAEALSISLESNVTDEEISFNEVFVSVFAAIANKMKSGEKLELETLLESDAFSTEVATFIEKEQEAEYNRAIKRWNPDKKIRMKKFIKMFSKLRATTRIVTKVVTIIRKINITVLSTKRVDGLNPLEIISKATEVVTKSLEIQISAVAKIKIDVPDSLIDSLVEAEENGEVVDTTKIADEVQSEDLNLAVENAEKVVNAVVAMGGIDTIAEKVEVAVKSAKEKMADSGTSESEEAVDSTKTDDLMSVILDEDTTTQYSEIYTEYKELGISPDAIIDATVEFNKGTTTVSIVELAVEKEKVITKTFSPNIAALEKANASLLKAVAVAKALLDAKDKAITELVVIEIVEIIYIIIEEPLVCEAGMHEENSVCVNDAPKVCPSGEYLDAVSNICKTVIVETKPTSCDTGYHINSINGECVKDNILETNTPVVVSNGIEIKNSEISFGKDSQAKTVKTVGGNFDTIEYSSISTISDSDKENILSSISFSFENDGFVNGATSIISIGLKIENTQNAQAIMVVTEKVDLTYSSATGFAFGFENAKEYGYGVKANETALLVQQPDNDVNFESNLNISSNNLTFEYLSLIKKIMAKDSDANSLVDTYFSKDGQEYQVSLYISGLDKFNGTKKVAETELTASFSGDLADSIKNKFDGTIFAISGKVKLND